LQRPLRKYFALHGNTSPSFFQQTENSMSRYIKVTEKDRRPVVLLAANRAFFASRGFKIEEPTQEEIESFFPEEKQSGNSNEAAQPLAQATAELTAEKAAHTETARSLAQATAEMEKVKAALIEAQKQISKLKKE
jgi:hypothetical protein